MNTRFFINMTKGSAGVVQIALVLGISLLMAHSAKSEIVELAITGHWSEKDFRVTDRLDGLFNPENPKFDGKVFGFDPSSGDLTLRLLVNTEGAMFFSKGSRFTAEGRGEYLLTHDFFGYRNVALAGGVYSFGSALWRSDGILAGLLGPEGIKAALWTDVDITKSGPTSVSFRMFGKADGLTADLFVGSRTHGSIGSQFLLWEYYKGEEIRSNKYTTDIKILQR